MLDISPLDDAQTALIKLHGDWSTENVEMALTVIPNCERERFLFGLLQANPPADVLRAAVEFVWSHDHAVLWEAFGASISAIDKLFRAAKFKSSHLPKSFEIWRGSVIPVGGSWLDAAGGISWTRDYDAACYFAVCYWSTRVKGEPLVLKRTIERGDVLAHITKRREEEIVTTAGWPVSVVRTFGTAHGVD